MINLFSANCRTVLVYTFESYLILSLSNGFMANRAFFWHFKTFFFARPHFNEYFFNVRNYISSPAHNNRVPYLYSQSFDFVEIVQCGAGHGDTTDLDRPQRGDWC